MPRPSSRERILQTGFDLLRERGYNATSVQDITDAAGVPKGSFYNHFESKEALSVEALRHYYVAARAYLEALHDESRPPLERLRTFFEGMRDAGRGEDFRCGCLMGALGLELANQSPAVRDCVAEGFETWTRELGQVIAEAQADGTVKRDLPADQLARFLLNAWQGTVLAAKVDQTDAAHELFQTVVFARLLT
jgi:TetR/AcrR family transcriptional repressor of nem operon